MDEQTFRNLPVGTRLNCVGYASAVDRTVTGPFDPSAGPEGGVPIGDGMWAVDAWAWEVVDPVQPALVGANAKHESTLYRAEGGYGFMWTGRPSVLHSDMEAFVSVAFGPKSEAEKVEAVQRWCERTGVTWVYVTAPNGDAYVCHHGQAQAEESPEAKHRAWIASLKPGDKVQARCPVLGDDNWRTFEIDTFPGGIDLLVPGEAPISVRGADLLLVRPVQPAQKPEPVVVTYGGGPVTLTLPNPHPHDVVPRFLYEEAVAKLRTEVEALQRALAHAAEREAELSRQLARERTRSMGASPVAMVMHAQANPLTGDADDPRSAGLLTVSDGCLSRTGRGW